jgi:hypothetical protein
MWNCVGMHAVPFEAEVFFASNRQGSRHSNPASIQGVQATDPVPVSGLDHRRISCDLRRCGPGRHVLVALRDGGVMALVHALHWTPS